MQPDEICHPPEAVQCDCDDCRAFTRREIATYATWGLVAVVLVVGGVRAAMGWL